MTDVQAAYGLIAVLEGNQGALAVAQSADYTIQMFGVNSVTLTTNVASPASWVGGVLVYEDTAGLKSHFVVTGIEDNVVTLFSQIHYTVGMEIGRTVYFIPGPLKTAEIYMGDPVSLKAAVDAGKEYFITVNVTAFDLKIRTMPGRRRTLQAFNVFFPFTVTAETPHTTGDATAGDAFRAFIMLPTLVEQVLFNIISYAVDERNRVKLAEGELAGAYVIWERAGSQVLRAGVIEFDLQSI